MAFHILFLLHYPNRELHILLLVPKQIVLVRLVYVQPEPFFWRLLFGLLRCESISHYLRWPVRSLQTIQGTQ